MRKRRYKKKREIRITTQLTKKQFIFFVACLGILMAVFIAGVSKENKPQKEVEDKEIVTTVSNIPTFTVVPVSEAEPTISPEYEAYGDPNNYVYPFNTMSADWGSELYESGFKYYQIPQEYIDGGGCFPEVVQAYLWCLCKEKEINYYVVVALIERESKYHWDASGDNGNSKGYMQIYENWHLDRMEEERVADLYNPYGNIRVGLNFLQELTGGGVNADYHYVLMSYNMGESKAKQFYKNGVYSTDYSTGILQRAQEIQQELQE
nr:MAG TPA: hypothetical protein [Caudoviricetes sp.]